MSNVETTRIADLLAGLAKFGATEKGGVTRLGYSEEDRAAQNWLLDQVKDLNLAVREDAVGNLFLRKEGTDPSLPAVAMGSHLDTVIEGGAYDGMVGVVAALEVVRLLEGKELKRALEVIVFRAEESSRFGFATMGSKFMAGKGDVEQFSTAGRKDDISFKEALTKWGCDPAKYKDAIIQKGAYDSFWEIHIEQGKVLEETNTTLGIVHNIAAPTRFKIIVEGLADHSGATPMGFRKDALVSAAKLILAVEEAATAEKENGTVATVGVVDVEPGSINVVPGQVTLWVDLRGVNETSIATALQSIHDAVKDVVDNDKVEVTMQMLTADKPVALSEDLAQLLENVCLEHGMVLDDSILPADGVKFMHMNSGAGHDAMHMADLVPTSMLFVPCRGGISHNPAEHAEVEDIKMGIDIMAEAVFIRANA